MTTRVRVLFVTHDYPFPVRYGGQVYTGNVLVELAGNPDVALRVISFDTRSDAPNSATVLAVPWEFVPKPRPPKIRLIASTLPTIAIRNRSSEFRDRLKKLLDEGHWDVVVLDYIAIGWTWRLVKRRLRGSHQGGRLVYMSHNVETILRRDIASSLHGSFAKRAAAYYDYRRGARLERRLSQGSDLVTVETADDGAGFRRLFGVESIIQLTPGYDGNVVAERNVRDAHARRSVLVLGGRLSTMKQVVLDAFLEGAANHLLRAGIDIDVVGPMPEAYMKGRAALFPGVRFHGYIDDVEPFLRQARLGIIADHVGGGFKHRILTHVFNRVPIIANRESMAGLPLRGGIDYVEVGAYSEIPAAVGRAIDNPEELDRLQASAFNACFEAFSWKHNVEEFVGRLKADIT